MKYFFIDKIEKKKLFNSSYTCSVKTAIHLIKPARIKMHYRKYEPKIRTETESSTKSIKSNQTESKTDHQTEFNLNLFFCHQTSVVDSV